jgi:hypothetical protein
MIFLKAFLPLIMILRREWGGFFIILKLYVTKDGRGQKII